MYPKHAFRFVRHFRTDRWYRTRVIVPTSMILNAAFTLMYFSRWLIDNNSNWFLFLSGYYAGMTSLRIHLTRSKNRIDSAKTVDEAKSEKELTVRKTGMYLLLVGGAVGLVSNQILYSSHDFYYPLWMLLILSFYSIFAFFMAISNMIHDHLEDWLIRSTRSVSMVAAITGLYVLTASILIYTRLTGQIIHTVLDIEGTIVFFLILGISFRLMLLPDIGNNKWNVQ